MITGLRLYNPAKNHVLVVLIGSEADWFKPSQHQFQGKTYFDALLQEASYVSQRLPAACRHGIKLVAMYKVETVFSYPGFGREIAKEAAAKGSEKQQEPRS